MAALLKPATRELRGIGLGSLVSMQKSHACAPCPRDIIWIRISMEQNTSALWPVYFRRDLSSLSRPLLLYSGCSWNPRVVAVAIGALCIRVGTASFGKSPRSAAIASRRNSKGLTTTNRSVRDSEWFVERAEEGRPESLESLSISRRLREGQRFLKMMHRSGQGGFLIGNSKRGVLILMLFGHVLGNNSVGWLEKLVHTLPMPGISYW